MDRGTPRRRTDHSAASASVALKGTNVMPASLVTWGDTLPQTLRGVVQTAGAVGIVGGCAETVARPAEAVGGHVADGHCLAVLRGVVGTWVLGYDAPGLGAEAGRGGGTVRGIPGTMWECPESESTATLTRWSSASTSEARMVQVDTADPLASTEEGVALHCYHR